MIIILCRPSCCQQFSPATYIFPIFQCGQIVAKMYAHMYTQKSLAGYTSRTCKKEPILSNRPLDFARNYLEAFSTATATATVAPTMGLLPMPIRPIISTCAGTEEEPAN